MLSSSRFIVAIHALSVIATHAVKGPVCSKHRRAERQHQSRRHPPPHARSGTGRPRELRARPRRRIFAEARRPRGISLFDIYKAVEDDGIFRMHKIDPHSECPIGAVVAKFLTKPLRSAEEALEKSLADTSLKDIAAHIA